MIDALAVGRNERGHELGAEAASTLVRVVEGVHGDVELDLDYAPRPEYGLILPLFQPVDGGVRAIGGADRLALSSPIPFDMEGASARVRFTVGAGERVAFALQHRTSSQPAPALWSQAEIEARLADTAEAWRTWSALHQAYDGPWKELVHHSGRVLYALTYSPTGAICAAPTTSLPEVEGGSRNWDYRFTWVRDASFTLQALWVAACPDEADKFFDYLSSAAASQVHRGRDLQIMFGIGGEHDLTERELPRLRGWRNSAPVRVGNGAVEPASARRLRRAAGRRGAAARAGCTAEPGQPRVPRRPGRRGCGALAGQGPRHLGDPRRAARLPLLEAHVLGRARPGDHAGRRVGRRRSCRRLEAHPREDRTSDPDSRMERARRARSRSRSAPTTSTPRT